MKNLKKHIDVGCLIRTEENTVYEVIYCGEKTFSCKPLHLLESEMEITQEFYYTIPMVVYSREVTNISQKDL